MNFTLLSEAYKTAVKRALCDSFHHPHHVLGTLPLCGNPSTQVFTPVVSKACLFSGLFMYTPSGDIPSLPSCGSES